MALPEHLVEMAKRVSNWGRWGTDDERGTVNLITPEAIRRGAACVRAGRSISLALALDEHGPQTGAIPGRVNPQHSMVAVNMLYTGDPSDFATSDDAVAMGLQACTHWDALAHVSYEGLLYNGFPADSITERGAARCGIDKVGPIATRGVLLDVARVLDVERLEGGYAITADDLDAAERLARLQVQPGDVVVVRTGHMQLFRAGDRAAYSSPAPGLSTMTIEWLHARDVAAVATDNLTFEVFPCEEPAVLLPVHMIHLRDMGLLQGQNWDLEELSVDCAHDGVYEFFLEATPEPFTNATGSPVVPVATK